ncbi:hypothetical protein QOZ80_2AG0108400 [Eleusine coracana subsp. coracana]|nr:hypothetical protein QOZ80_2AG0108400 [Eleusine coracana subsp. coracana]
MEHWKEILEKKEWQNLKHRDDIMPALKISYDYLPFHLKKCFSYCALFPEDHRFDSSELARFWDAIGLIDTSGQTDSAQDLGSNYLKELIDNGFVIKQGDGWSQYYILHDLLHELCNSISAQECVSISFSGFEADKIPLSVRHISVIVQDKCFENLEEEMDKLKRRIDIRNLRSLMILQGNQRNKTYRNDKHVSFLKDTFNEIKNLRVLFIDLKSQELESLLHNFSKLIHLRYLHIEFSGYVSSVVSRFYHLNYLFLMNNSLTSLYPNDSMPVPKDFNRLINLRHLCAPSEFHSNIPGVGKLQCLEELNAFCVKKESVGFELAELGKLKKLRGRLIVHNLEKVRTKEEAEEAKLKNKCNLNELSLDFDRGQQPAIGHEHDVIDGLQPHPSLEVLRIFNHSGPTGPSWLTRDICVTTLECLYLSGVSWDILPPFGRLPLLKSLSLFEIGGLRQLRLDSGGLTDISFKHLEKIILCKIPDLVE